MAQAESSDYKTDDGKPILKSFDDLYNDLEVTFILYLESDYYDDAKRKIEEFEKKFKLTTSWKTSNMCCFDAQRHIVKYETIGDILETYYVERLELYNKRKAHQIGEMKDHIEELEAKAIFVKGIVNGTLRLLNQPDDVVLKSLKDHKLPPRSDREKPDSLDAYEYLLRLRIDRIKKSAVIEIENDLVATKAKLAELIKTTVGEIWAQELDEFSAAWHVHHEKVLNILYPDNKSKVVKKTKKIVKMVT
jgi:DNA topoisomerase-2